MRYLPVGLDLRDRPALVVGAGPEIPAKVERLLAAGARVTVIAADPDPAMLDLAARGAVALHRRAPEDADMDGAAVVFAAPAATPVDALREARWYARARSEGRLVCAVDRPESSTFVNLALARAPSLTVAVGTDGASPALARRIREDLEAAFADPRFARFIARLAALRTSLPRGARARAADAVKGFALEVALRFPAWVERDEDP
jgi:precorrin-2 dehydrogenase/sirohydrochlorin ferrochelatase